MVEVEKVEVEELEVEEVLSEPVWKIVLSCVAESKAVCRRVPTEKKRKVLFQYVFMYVILDVAETGRGGSSERRRVASRIMWLQSETKTLSPSHSLPLLL